MVNYEQGEAIIKTGPVRWVGHEGERPGVLTLTNRAVIFEGPVPQPPPGGWGAQRPGAGPMGRRPGGPPTPPPPIVLAPGALRIPLWRFRGANAVPGPQGPDLSLVLLQRTRLFRTNEAEAWAHAIRQARTSAPPAPPGVLEKAGGGMAPAKLHCEYCGKASPAGSQKCESCGAPFDE